MLLEYQKEILKESNGKNVLLIAASGLGIQKILEINVKFYANRNSMAIILNLNDEDKSKLLKLEDPYIKDISTVGKAKRQKSYTEGGAFISSSRVVISDMIDKTIEIEKISCIIINNVETLKETSGESFIIYMYREKNKDGLIKAFSENPTTIAIGYSPLERISKALKVENILFYPRFHETVKSTIKNDVNLAEYKFKTNKKMSELQIVLIEILTGLLRIILNKEDREEINYESILFNNAKKVFNVLGVENKRVSLDIYNIKTLITILFSGDIMLFNSFLNILIQDQIAVGKDATWINSSATHVLLQKTEELYNSYINKCLLVKDDNSLINEINTVEKIKDDALKNDSGIIENIYKNKIIEKDAVKINGIEERIDSIEESNTVENNSKIKRLKLDNSDQLNNNDKNINEEELDITKLHPENISKKNIKNFYLLNQKLKKLIEILNKRKKEKILILVPYKIITTRLTHILYLFDLKIEDEDNKESNVLILTHYEFKSYEKNFDICIFLSPSQTSVRKIEIYGIKNKVSVYFLRYSNSLEEEIYLNEIRKEKESFEKLIEERSNLPLQINIEEEVIDLEEIDVEERKYRIIVDCRELRADLCYFLYRAKNEILISTLPVGDYILGKNTGIERKEIHDFISSLSSGRLYLQTSNLCYSFSKPYILLEFNSRPCISDYYTHNQDTFKNSILARFTLFLFNFPQIKVIWSDSKLFSTKIIRDLQKQESTTPVLEETNTIDPILQEIVLSIPGINQFNLKRIIKNFKCLKDIVSASKTNLENLLGVENGLLVYNFFRNKNL